MKVGDFMLGNDCYSNYYWFLQVVKVTASMVSLRRVRNVDGVPVLNDFADDNVITKRLKDNSVSLGTWSGATLWDGVPFHSKDPNWGVNWNLY